MKTKQDFPSINERPPEGLKEDGSKVRVLVVDDNVINRKVAIAMIESYGFIVDDVDSGTIIIWTQLDRVVPISTSSEDENAKRKSFGQALRRRFCIGGRAVFCTGSPPYSVEQSPTFRALRCSAQSVP